ncbi:MAG: sulfotransferase [Phycisphaerales bacterium]|nr:sulfotransferase [Phycisphaerales bacterium]
MAKNPRKAAELFLKGTEAIKAESFSVAKTMLTKAHELDRDNPDIMLRLGQVLIASGFARESVEIMKKCVKRKPNYPDSMILLSQGFMEIGQIDEMHRILDKALAWDPTHGVCIHAKVTGYINSGELELAEEVVKKTYEIQNPHPLIYMCRGKLYRAQKDYSKGVEEISKIFEHPDARDRHKRSARFEMGHLHDAMGEYDTAFEHFKIGNSGHIQGRLLHAPTMISMWSPEMLSNIPQSENDSHRPVFVVGMPRSGTTLTEQILAAHPKVAGIGECSLTAHMLRRRTPTSLTSNDIESYAKEYLDYLDERVDGDVERTIDKHIGAERTLGLISRMFPNAKVIHCLRSPVDSCLSSYFQNFGVNVPYSRDLVSLGKQYVAHRQVMDHWYEVLDLEILQSPYEQLVDDSENRSRLLVDHIGLEFDEQCLRFHDSKKYIGTASSVQVRKPIYKSSRERWRNYEKHIGPLIDQLGEYADID